MGFLCEYTAQRCSSAFWVPRGLTNTCEALALSVLLSEDSDPFMYSPFPPPYNKGILALWYDDILYLIVEWIIYHGKYKNKRVELHLKQRCCALFRVSEHILL